MRICGFNHKSQESSTLFRGSDWLQKVVGAFPDFSLVGKSGRRFSGDMIGNPKSSGN